MSELDALTHFLPESDEEPDQQVPARAGTRPGVGARGLQGRRWLQPHRKAALTVAARQPGWMALVLSRLPRRLPGFHVASFGGGIVVGVLAMQFVGVGESAQVGSSALTPSVPIPAALPSVAALHSSDDVTATSGEKPVESGAVPDSFRTAETPPTGAATNYRGGLRIDSRPANAAVFVNNQQVGHTPLVLSSLQVGSRAIRIQLSGYATWSRAVRVVANQQAAVSAQLVPME